MINAIQNVPQPTITEDACDIENAAGRVAHVKTHPYIVPRRAADFRSFKFLELFEDLKVYELVGANFVVDVKST